MKPLPRLVALVAALAAAVALALVLPERGGDRVAVVAPAAAPTPTAAPGPLPAGTTPPSAAPTLPADTLPAPAAVVDVADGGATTCRIAAPDLPCGAPPPTTVPALPGCPDEPRGAVVDKAAQRFWLCQDGLPITDARPMTTASEAYGLPPIGTHRVFAKDRIARGIHGETLHRFVAFYTTPRGNRIAFHEYVHQPEDTVGDLDRRGESSGCLRVRTDDSWMVWDFLQVGDAVAVITP